MKIEYIAEVAFKIDWQEAKRIADADPVFLDDSQPNRGLNAKASNYSGKEGYDIHLAFDAVVREDATGRDTVYRALSPAFSINDYNESESAPFTCSIAIKDEDGNDISGFIPTGKQVRMVATWILSTGSLDDYPNAYAFHRMEVANNATYSIAELASHRDNPSNIALKPESGETGVKVEYSGGEIITSCLIDGNAVANGARYKLSCRLGLGEQGFAPPVLDLGTLTPDTDTGITEFTLSAVAGAGTLEATDPVTIEVYDNSTDDLHETITGLYTANLSTYATDTPTGSILAYLSGTLEDGGTIEFNKLSWAAANGLVNEDAIALRIEMRLIQGFTGLPSNTATGLYAIERQEAEFSDDLRFLQTDGRKIYTGQYKLLNEDYFAVDITQKYSEELFTAPFGVAEALRSAIIDGDSTFGSPWSKLIILENSGSAPYQRIQIMDTADGENWTNTLLFEDIAGVNKVASTIIRDALREANGEAVYWIGTQDASGGGGSNLLFMLYFDGVDWQKVNFTTKLGSVAAAGQARYTAGATVDGDVYGLVDSDNAALEHLVFRMQQTSGDKEDPTDFTNLANWTNATVMAGGAVSGTTDGNGTSARFGEMFNLIVLTDDGTRPLTIWVTDGGNSSIRLLTYNAGLDNYDVTTVIGLSGTPGDDDGIGTSARLNDPRGLVIDGNDGYIGENGNKLIRKVDMTTLEVTTWLGTGDNAFRLSTLY